MMSIILLLRVYRSVTVCKNIAETDEKSLVCIEFKFLKIQILFPKKCVKLTQWQKICLYW